VRSFSFAPKGEPRGTVALLHGWAGQALFMAGFVEPLLARGFRVVAFDLPAHGASSGRRLTFPLAIEAFGAVLRAAGLGGGEALAGMIGHSFGGALAKAAIAGGVPVFPAIRARRLVSLSAPAGMQQYGRQFSREIGLSERGHRAFEGEAMALTGRGMESFSGVAYLRQSHVPSLVIHSRDDRKIPFSDAEALAGAGAHVRLLPLSGLGHSRILFAKEAIGAAVDFVAGPD
jgi:pimeloyl-ACP methyl ester carboxylesterase